LEEGQPNRPTKCASRGEDGQAILTTAGFKPV